MKASKDRSEQFMHTTANSTLQASNSMLLIFPALSKTELMPDSLLFQQQSKGGPGSGLPGVPGDRKGKARALPDNGDGQDFLALDIDGDRGESGQMKGGDGYQQMQLVEQQVGPSLFFLGIIPSGRDDPDPQDDFIQSRSTAIESIESTISELGQIFSQLAGMVAEQRETVQRIDADTTDIAA
jgi:syntaxin 5